MLYIVKKNNENYIIKNMKSQLFAINSEHKNNSHSDLKLHVYTRFQKFEFSCYNSKRKEKRNSDT